MSPSTSQYARAKPGAAGQAPVDPKEWHLARRHVAWYCHEQHPGRSKGAKKARAALWRRMAEMLGIDSNEAGGHRTVNVTGGESPDTMVRASRSGGAA